MKSVTVIAQDCNVPMVCLKPDNSGALKVMKGLPLPLDGTKCGENKV